MSNEFAYQVDETDKEFYEKAWDVLVEHAGASKREVEKDSFVYECMKVGKYPMTEYRFCGNLGFGGKFRRRLYENMSCYVDCYRENETPEILKICKTVNSLLQKLINKYNPKNPRLF